MRWTRQVLTAYILIVVYAICFRIQAPVEPFLVKKLSEGEDATVLYAKVKSAFNAAQMVGTFAMGPFLDRFGGRIGFVLAFSSGVCSYSLLAIAETMDMVYLSKVPSAFMHPFLVAQAFMSQHTSQNDIAEALALLVTAYTIGATIGPLIGGYLGASGDYALGAKVSAGGLFLNVLLAILFLGGETGEGVQNKHEKIAGTAKAPHGSFLIGYRKVVTNPAVLLVLMTKICSSTLNSVFETIFPVILSDNFSLKQQEMGYVFSASQLLNALVSKFAVGPLSAKLTRELFCCYSLLFMALCYMGASVFMPGTAGLELFVRLVPIHPSIPFASFTLLVFAAAFARGPAFTAVNTTLVPDDLKGTAISMEHTMFSLSGFITPLFTSWLTAAMGAGAVCALVSVLESANAFSWRINGVPVIRRIQGGLLNSESKKED